MKTLILILSLLLLTSCSNPDTSGGVTLSRGGGDWDNTFPNGSCKGPDQFDNQGSKTGCGWVHSDEGSHYITSCSNPETWDGVTLSRGCGNDSTNVFPYGSCLGPGANAPSSGKTGCGWVSAHGKTHYFMPQAKLEKTNLGRATLIGANLSGAKLWHAYLRWANLRDANLSYAILRDADLIDAYLRDANLSNADLSDADLSNADLYGADLSGANLSGAEGNKYTICPNGHSRNTSGNNCGF